jgi:ankyrin repeat protein
MIKYPYSQDMDFKTKNRFGNTAMHCSEKKGYEHIVNYLLHVNLSNNNIQK